MQRGPLETVADYIGDMRTLLLDTISPYRYSDPDLVTALNLAIQTARRDRPDLFVYHHHDKVPYFTQNDATEVHMEAQFRQALSYIGCSHALARDQEDVQDARATSFMAFGLTILTGQQPAPIQGGTPNQQKR